MNNQLFDSVHNICTHTHNLVIFIVGLQKNFDICSMYDIHSLIRKQSFSKMIFLPMAKMIFLVIASVYTIYCIRIGITETVSEGFREYDLPLANQS